MRQERERVYRALINIHPRRRVHNELKNIGDFDLPKHCFRFIARSSVLSAFRVCMYIRTHSLLRVVLRRICNGSGKIAADLLARVRIRTRIVVYYEDNVLGIF